ncbi:mitochondrial 37S ribosomal protein bS6m MRP17 [Rhodotorula paludigena]|uniref:mitochondrial 37S ribosomal protein bS6m MRP17 n=1 Tax=Rhodotorula paludigena TaxID=86838 RepID=UPI0031727037
MPLYELTCIAKHSSNLAPLHQLLRSSSALVAQSGGVVRSLDHWGTRNLPAPMKVGKRRGGGGGGEDGGAGKLTGDYWTMRFDCSPPVLSALNSRLRLDPSVLRWTTLKVGATLEQVTDLGKTKSIRFARELPARTGADEGRRTAWERI